MTTFGVIKILSKVDVSRLSAAYEKTGSQFINLFVFKGLRKTRVLFWCFSLYQTMLHLIERNCLLSARMKSNQQ